MMTAKKWRREEALSGRIVYHTKSVPLSAFLVRYTVLGLELSAGSFTTTEFRPQLYVQGGESGEPGTCNCQSEGWGW